MLAPGRANPFRAPLLGLCIRPGSVLIFLTETALRTTPVSRTAVPLLWRAIRIATRVAAGITVPGCCANLEFVQLIPLRIGTIAFRDCKKLPDTTARVNSLWIIHAVIMNHTA